MAKVHKIGKIEIRVTRTIICHLTSISSILTLKS